MTTRFATFLLLMLLTCLPLRSETRMAGDIKVELTAIATGLEQPWSFSFLPQGGFLLTLRGGELRHYRPDGSFNRIAGLPQILAEGQGGLLDVVVARDFAKTRLIYLAYTSPAGRLSVSSLARATLSPDGARLENLGEIFRANQPEGRALHYGGRIVEMPDHTLFLTLGERGNRPSAQDLSLYQGKIIRIHRNGKIPNDNPLANSPIWSYGHRNPQGLALDPKGQLWAHEHGARGGDEVNLISKGTNYGWPVISYGTHYNGGKIGEGTHKQGMAQPKLYWDPSIAPSGLAIHSGNNQPQWRGNFFVGSLKFGHITRLVPSKNGLRQAEIWQWPETGRVRDIREAPDGSLWFLSVGQRALFRISPIKK